MSNELKTLMENAGLKYTGELEHKPATQVRSTVQENVQATLESALMAKYLAMKSIDTMAEAAPNWVRRTAGAALGTLGAVGAAIPGAAIAGPVGGAIAAGVVGKQGYDLGANAADWVYDKVTGKKKPADEIDEEYTVTPTVGTVPPVVPPGGTPPTTPPGAPKPPTAPGAASPSALTPGAAAAGGAPPDLAAQQQQKTQQRKAVQDQIAATTKQLSDLRTQLSSIG